MGRSTSSRIIALSALLLLILGAWMRPSTAYASDLHCFDQTGFCVSNPTIWDYFTHRGGVNAFGYPVSRQFLFQESQVQFFQRRIIQIEPNGQTGLLNVLDPGLMPYTEFNGATFPAIDSELTASAPSPTDQAATLAWVKEYTPDTWNGMPVNFYKTFSNTVTCAIAYPDGNCQTQFIPGFNLEMWGIPTSLPMLDPNNHNFVYLRFQRGVMMYNASNETTQGILLGQYLKAILAGRGLPADLFAESQSSDLWLQYWPGAPRSIRGGTNMQGADLTSAFVPDDTQGQSAAQAKLAALNGCEVEEFDFVRGAMMAGNPTVLSNFLAGFYWGPGPHAIPANPSGCLYPSMTPTQWDNAFGEPANPNAIVAAQYLFNNSIVIQDPGNPSKAVVNPTYFNPSDPAQDGSDLHSVLPPPLF